MASSLLLRRFQISFKNGARAHASVPFSKYSGCGNDFILIDNRQKIFDAGNVDLIVSVCHRRLGVGADGMIMLEKSQAADFAMRIFNADGSEAEMCGNGIRCLARFIQEIGVSGDHFLIETMHHLVPVALLGELVKVHMPEPLALCWSVVLRLEDISFTIHHLDTGVPHAVLFVDDLEEQGLMKLAAQIRYHPYFSPKGVNVNFAAVAGSGEIGIRTYERGVEAETLSCGTGAAAVAVVCAVILEHSSPITICPRSGDRLNVWFEKNKSSVSCLQLIAPAIKIDEGTFVVH